MRLIFLSFSLIGLFLLTYQLIDSPLKQNPIKNDVIYIQGQVKQQSNEYLKLENSNISFKFAEGSFNLENKQVSIYCRKEIWENKEYCTIIKLLIIEE